MLGPDSGVMEIPRVDHMWVIGKVRSGNPGPSRMVFPRNSIDSLPTKTCCVFQLDTGGGVGRGKERQNPLANIIHQTIPSRFPRGSSSWRY